MNWDYEIVSEQVVLDLSYRTVKDILEKDIEKNGFGNAMIRAAKNMDVAVNHLRECNSGNYVDKCDEAYRILLSTYTAMMKVSLKYVHNVKLCLVHIFNVDLIPTRNNYPIENSIQLISNELNIVAEVIIESLRMIQAGKSRYAVERKIKKEKRGEDWPVIYAYFHVEDDFDKSTINQEIAIYKFFNNFNGTKSIGVIFAERMNKIIHTYCQNSGENERSVNKKMYKESDSFMGGIDDTSAVIRGLGKLLFNSEERYNTPFRYYERKGW